MRLEVVLGERTEPDDVVDAVDELGLEEVQRVARQVRGHDQHDVGEVDRAALAVGEAAVVEHLQQDVEHVGVGLLDLVEQHHRVGPAAHGLGELAALVVADVAGRRADEAATPSASPCTRYMSMRTIARSSSKRNSARARASSVLPTPVGPEEQERADRAVRVGQPGPAAADGVGHRGDRLVLADDPLVQDVLHADELVHLALHEADDRDAGPLATRPRRRPPRRPPPSASAAPACSSASAAVASSTWRSSSGIWP